MGAHCCEHDTPAAHTLQNPARYRRILWIALTINAAMFLVEIVAGVRSGSLSLLADAIDFAGDALNYGVSIAVLSAALAWRARAAMVKAVSMGGFGLVVLGQAIWHMWAGDVPDGTTMGLIGTVALLANVAVAWMLYAYREGDANMRSVWLCSRNDAIGNIAVMLAGLGVLGTGSRWPDLLVAAGMASLALQSAWLVWRQARNELAHPEQAADHDDHGHAH
jgi:cation diffusion facilitator family transporter